MHISNKKRKNIVHINWLKTSGGEIKADSNNDRKTINLRDFPNCIAVTNLKW